MDRLWPVYGPPTYCGTGHFWSRLLFANEMACVHPLWGNDTIFFPVSDFAPPFPTNFSHSVENFSDFTFFRKISWKFWWPFLVIDYKFCIPLFFPVSLFHYISPLISRKLFIIFSSNFTNFFPSFREIYMFFTYFMRISFPPFFDHDAFMHHTMHWTPLTVMIVTNILINLEL